MNNQNKNKKLELKDIRKKIDAVDAKIVASIAERVSYMPAVAKYKKENNLPIHQPDREKEIIQSRVDLAEKTGVSRDLIQKIFSLILENSREIQEQESKK